VLGRHSRRRPRAPQILRGARQARRLRPGNRPSRDPSLPSALVFADLARVPDYQC